MILAVITMRFISALIQVESGGNDRAVGDYVNGLPTSFGCLQISEKVLTDVSRISGCKVTYANAFRRLDAIWICQTYLYHYATAERLGHEPTFEDYARIWNGGPDGWREKATLPHAVKVAREMDKIDDGKWEFDFRVTDRPTVWIKPRYLHAR